jgi:tripartite-type tricarboxylate transporter receptor subunit TctC
MRKNVVLFAFISIICMMAAFANGEKEGGAAWPPRTVEIFTPSAATSGTDAIAQIMTTFLAKTYGVNSYVTSNNAGAGLVSLERVRNGQKDGSEMIFDTVQLILRNQIGTYEHDVWEEFTVISGVQIYNDQPMVTVRADSPYNSLQDLIDDAKARPGEVSIPTGPRGNVVHLRAVGFEKDAGIELRKVDASGDAERITSLLGGVTDFLLLPPVTANSYVENGDMKYLSYLGNERSPTNESVPCNAELGYPVSLPNFAGLHVLAGPKGMDPAVVTAIQGYIKALFEDEESRTLIFRLENGYPMYETPEDSIAKLQAFSKTVADFNY